MIIAPGVFCRCSSPPPPRTRIAGGTRPAPTPTPPLPPSAGPFPFPEICAFCAFLAEGFTSRWSARQSRGSAPARGGAADQPFGFAVLPAFAVAFVAPVDGEPERGELLLAVQHVEDAAHRPRYPPDRSWSASSNTTCRMNVTFFEKFPRRQAPSEKRQSPRRRARGSPPPRPRVAIRERRIGSQTGGFQQGSPLSSTRESTCATCATSEALGAKISAPTLFSPPPVPVAQQVGEDGHEVAQGLARAGLGGDHHVLPRGTREGLRLHVRRGLEPEAAQRREHRGVRVLELRTEPPRARARRRRRRARRRARLRPPRRRGAARKRARRTRPPLTRVATRVDVLGAGANRDARYWGRAPRRRGSLRASRPSRRSLARRRRRVRDARTRREARGETKSAARPARSRASRRSPSTSKGARAGRGVVVRGAPLAFARGRGATSRRRVGNPKRPTVYGFHNVTYARAPGCVIHPVLSGWRRRRTTHALARDFARSGARRSTRTRATRVSPAFPA